MKNNLDKLNNQKPLEPEEKSLLLRFLSRLIANTKNETIHRIANSLFILLVKQKYR